MKQRNLFIDDAEWAKLAEIAADMDRKGINVKDQRKQLSKAAAVRELIRAYDLPAKPKQKGKTS